MPFSTIKGRIVGVYRRFGRYCRGRYGLFRIRSNVFRKEAGIMIDENR